MTKYESVLIARQDLGASQVNNLVSEMSNVIANQGVKLSALITGV